MLRLGLKSVRNLIICKRPLFLKREEIPRNLSSFIFRINSPARSIMALLKMSWFGPTVISLMRLTFVFICLCFLRVSKRINIPMILLVKRPSRLFVHRIILGSNQSQFLVSWLLLLGSVYAALMTGSLVMVSWDSSASPGPLGRTSILSWDFWCHHSIKAWAKNH